MEKIYLSLNRIYKLSLLNLSLFDFDYFRPVDTVGYFSGTHEKRGLPFSTRQMIYKELLKERVKRNIRIKSDKHEMPISINRQVDSTPKPYVFFFSSYLTKKTISFDRKPPAAFIKLQPKTITPSGTNVSMMIFHRIVITDRLGSTGFLCEI